MYNTALSDYNILMCMCLSSQEATQKQQEYCTKISYLWNGIGAHPGHVSIFSKYLTGTTPLNPSVNITLLSEMYSFIPSEKQNQLIKYLPLLRWWMGTQIICGYLHAALIPWSALLTSK
jgi:hypothetical protein